MISYVSVLHSVHFLNSGSDTAQLQAVARMAYGSAMNLKKRTDIEISTGITVLGFTLLGCFSV